MTGRQSTARWAGILYFLFMLIAIYTEFLLPRLVVPGDATATAANINGNELTYRFGILAGLATHVIFLFLVVVLYRLLADVDKGLAMLMVVLVSVGVAVALANMLNRFAPLQLLGGDAYLSAFSKPQLDALAFGSQRFRSAGALVPMAFWGLWLFPFGLLVIRSEFLPRILGVLLLVAGTAYIVSSATGIVLPAWRSAMTPFMMPLYMGEVPIIFWLLIKGTKPNVARMIPS
jgi:hypothetical protein